MGKSNKGGGAGTQNEKVEAGTKKKNTHSKSRTSPNQERRRLSHANLLEFLLVVQGDKNEKILCQKKKLLPVSLLVLSSPAQVNKSKYLLKYFYRVRERLKVQSLR